MVNKMIAGWIGSYVDNGSHSGTFEFSTEAAACAWATFASRRRPWVKVNVREVSEGGKWTRSMRIYSYVAGTRQEDGGNAYG